jgi:hypothetical protein
VIDSEEIKRRSGTLSLKKISDLLTPDLSQYFLGGEFGLTRCVSMTPLVTPHRGLGAAYQLGVFP